jgi:uncharacterized oligopeptide transporter (OPT) family protein
MDWLNNANTVASLVLAMIGIGGSLYGAISYLKKKASRIPQGMSTMSQQASAPTPSQQPVMSLPQFTWLEWTELLAQGLVDTMDFILHICFRDMEQDEEMSIIAKIALGLFICCIGMGIGVFIFGIIIINALLSGLGIPNPSGASGVIAFILLFAVLSFIYIYHVGLRVERKRQEQYKSSKQPQRAQQSMQR